MPRFFSKPEVRGAFHSSGMTLDSLSFYSITFYRMAYYTQTTSSSKVYK